MSSFADAEPRRKSTVTFADDSKSTKKDKKDKKEKKEKKEKKSKKEKDKKSSSKSKESSGAAAGGVSEEELFKLSYTLKEPLGSGTFSEVRRAIRKEDKAQVAVKCIRKRDLAPEDQAAIRAEISILRTIHHPNIIDLYEVFNTSEMIYIVTEFVEGGELFNRIVQREFYNEKDAQKVVATIATALDYCHKRKIVHRDLKPENILLTSAEDDSSIKIADFGFAKQVHKRASMQHALQTACGTPGYIAPEILAGVKYGASVDMWSLGVILYILLCGYPPFFHENQDKMFKSISKGEYEFHKEYWGAVSESAKELIRGLLCVDPDQRFTAEEVLKHPWIMEEHDKDITPALTQLREFKNKRRWKTAYNVVNAALTLTSGAAGASG